MPNREPVVKTVNLSRNDLVRDYRVSDPFRQMFQADILPSRQANPYSFSQSDVFGQLYQTDREWIDDRLFGEDGDTNRYEKLIDTIFWKHSDRSRVLFLLGTIGCGKSTLIDYYLRCYCPTISPHQGQFEKKIVVSFDAGNVRDSHESYQLFFNDCQESIIASCERFGIDINRLVTAEDMRSSSVRHWVDRAIVEMSKQSKKPDSPFKYLVIVVDNIDQTGIEVQRKILKWVSSWLSKERVSIYKVIIPLWPATLVRIQDSSTNLLRNSTQIRLGNIKRDSLIRPRLENLAWAVMKDFLGDASEIALRLEKYVKDSRATVGNWLESTWIRRLCNGDLRRELSIWEGMLSGKILYSVWESREAGVSRSFQYDILEAMIVGSYATIKHTSDTRDCTIYNIFNIGHAHNTPRDLLVGCYALHLLRNGYRDAESWYTTLAKLGFSADNLRTAEGNLIAMNVIHQIPPGASNDKSYVFNIHDSVADAYFELCEQAAYLDNVAMITPVDKKFHDRMRATSSLRAEDFASRARTTIAFIEFVRENEDSFHDSLLSLVSDGRLTPELVNSVHLPRIWKRMAAGYRDRLEGLYRSRSMALLDEDVWKSLLDAPVLREAETATDSLVMKPAKDANSNRVV